MSYFLLKIIHIISASLFVGSLLASFCFTFAYQKITDLTAQDQQFNRLIKQNLYFGLLTLAIQPISGLAIIAIKHYNPMSLWVIGTLISYASIGCLWLTMIFQYYRCALAETQDNPKPITVVLYWQKRLLLISLPIFLVLYYLMANRPE